MSWFQKKVKQPQIEIGSLQVPDLREVSLVCSIPFKWRDKNENRWTSWVHLMEIPNGIRYYIYNKGSNDEPDGNIETREAFNNSIMAWLYGNLTNVEVCSNLGVEYQHKKTTVKVNSQEPS